MVLDDGLQNPALAKDSAFAVIDGEAPFGNGLCIPPARCGRRGCPGALRAVLIVIGGDEATLASIAAEAPGKPLLLANLQPDALAAAPLIGREVVAFAGIARPEKFYATLRRVGRGSSPPTTFPITTLSRRTRSRR